jgi:DNA-binding MarR family transcriptional regulator
VAGRIQVEIQQKKPIKQLEEEAYLNVVRTADLLNQRLDDVLKPHDLTETQYNVLRILRGAGDDGLSCKDIGARMVTRDPDITRLLDRLEKRQLITRGRATTDRRYLTIRITESGLNILAALDEPIHQMHGETLTHLGCERLNALIEVLEAVRERLSG